MSYKEAACKVNQLVLCKEYRDALEAARHCVMRYHNDGDFYLTEIVSQIGYGASELAEMKQRADGGCAWSCLVLGAYYYLDISKSASWFAKGSELGCPVSKYYLGQAYGDQQQCVSILYLESARAGNRDSMVALGTRFERERDYVGAARWYARAVPEHFSACCDLRYLRNYHPYDIVPWGHWTATKVDWRLLTCELREEMRHWLMVARRLGVHRDIAVLICSFLVSANFSAG